jgi:hypothetical protein
VYAIHLAGEIDFQSFANDVNPKHSSTARDHAVLEVRGWVGVRSAVGGGQQLSTVASRIMMQRDRHCHCSGGRRLVCCTSNALHK